MLVTYPVFKVVVLEVTGRRKSYFCIHFFVMETLEVSPFSERFMKIPDREGH